MAIKGKMIYEQPQFTGDLSMKAHVQKEGLSEAISVQQIVDACISQLPETPSPEPVDSRKPGDIFLSANPDQPDAIVLDGTAVIDGADYPNLASLFGLDAGIGESVVRSFYDLYPGVYPTPLTITKHNSVTVLEMINEYFIVFESGNFAIVSRPLGVQSRRAVYVAGDIYLLAKIADGYQVARVKANSYQILQYGADDLVGILDSIADETFGVVQLGQRDLIVDFSSDLITEVTDEGLVELTLSGFGDYEDVGFGGAFCSASGRFFVSAIERSSTVRRILEVKRSGSTLSLESVGTINWCFNLVANSTHLYTSSKFVRGSGQPDILQMEIDTGVVRSVPEISSSYGIAYMYATDLSIIALNGQYQVYESTDGLSYSIKSASDYGLDSVYSLYLGAESKLINGFPEYQESEVIAKVKLPALNSSAERVKYFVKF